MSIPYSESLTSNVKDAAEKYLVDLHLQIELTMLYPENNRNIPIQKHNLGKLSRQTFLPKL